MTVILCFGLTVVILEPNRITTNDVKCEKCHHINQKQKYGLASEIILTHKIAGELA
jgi:nitrate reductase cytochrome c-type subunit